MKIAFEQYAVKSLSVISLGLTLYRKGFWVGLSPQGLISGIKRMFRNKLITKRTLFHYKCQIRNVNFNCNRNITKQVQILISENKNHCAVLYLFCLFYECDFIRQQVKEGVGGFYERYLFGGGVGGGG